MCNRFTITIPINPAKFPKFPSILCYLRFYSSLYTNRGGMPPQNINIILKDDYEKELDTKKMTVATDSIEYYTFTAPKDGTYFVELNPNGGRIDLTFNKENYSFYIYNSYDPYDGFTGWSGWKFGGL